MCVDKPVARSASADTLERSGGSAFAWREPAARGAPALLLVPEAVAQTQSVGETDNCGSRACIAATAGCRPADACRSPPRGLLDHLATNERQRGFVGQARLRGAATDDALALLLLPPSNSAS